ncbi:MAG TPA: DUF3617 domain-containing protein [Ramlibacter sp.]|nr:DUF3617 domain-containing protein [Ramlibacter sp.]
MSRLATTLALCAALGSGAALAQQQLKPGLWEMQHKAGGDSKLGEAMEQMRKEMANMPPEQRKQMEAMMSRSGVQVQQGPGGGMSARVCLTKEMAERNEVPASQGDCKITRQQRSGNTLTMAFTCTNPPSSGESQVTFHSPESYAMKTTATTTVEGKAERMTMEGSGKWLSADCGSVKPVPAR